MDFRYIELEETNARLQRDVKQLTEDNKLMWDLWKQVQASKPDITHIIALTADREAKKYAGKEKHIWTLIEERDTNIKQLEELLESKERELKLLSNQVTELKSSDATLRSRYEESAAIEERLHLELDRVNRQLIDSDDVNNRLLVSLEKENTALKNETEVLKRELCESENQVLKLKSSFEAANSSSSTLWSELASYRQMIAVMETEVNELKKKEAELRKSLDEKQLELEGVLASKEKISDELNRHLSLDLDFQIEALTARNKELEAECALLHKIPYEDDSAPENLIAEISNLKEQLARVTVAYEAKVLENEMLCSKSNDRLNAVERLHSEQRAIQDGLDGLDHRLKKDKDLPAEIELETSLETERLVALLKQHCRELANDRDVFAGRLEKTLMQMANRESSIADLKLKLASAKRDHEAEFRRFTNDYERRLGDNVKHQTSKLVSELGRQRNEIAAIEKKLETVQAEKRRMRSQLSACQARLTRESALSARQHDRIIELEQTALSNSAKLAAARSQMAEQKELGGGSKRRRAHSASFTSSQEETQPQQKKQSLTFDMTTQTDLIGSQIVLQPLDLRRPDSPTNSQSSKASRGKNSTTRQQLNVEKMRVGRLLRLATDLKSDRTKLRGCLDNERQSRQQLESALTTIRTQLSAVSSVNKQLENKLVVAEADLARTRKALIDSQQRVAELSLISPRVDKSVITDQLESGTETMPAQVPMTGYEELKQRMAMMLTTEREQAVRLSNFQVECERLAADLALAKERLNDSRRELAKEKRTCEELRAKLQAYDQQVASDAVQMKELAERLVGAEKTDKSVIGRMTALKRRIEEYEAEKISFQKQLTEKRVQCERLADQLKKVKTRCQYLEVVASAEKTNCNRLESECKDGVKKMQVQINIQNAQIAEFRRFIEMYLDMLIERIRQDRRTVGNCEMSDLHNKKRRDPSPGRRGAASERSDGSIASRAASMAQAHLKLSAAEAAELLMTGSVDASPPSSSLGFDTPEAFQRRVANILQQICSPENDVNEDSAQFAHRLSDAFFNGFMDHIRYLLTRPPCCLNIVLNRVDRGDFSQRANRRFNFAADRFSIGSPC